MPDDTTARRKDAHLDLCATEEVEPQGNRTLFECVKLVHCALPELSFDDIDLSTELFGKRLKAPFLITGMTGGTDRAEKVNRDLATVAEAHGVAFGVGSQRAMSEAGAPRSSFQVRDVAPSTVVIGNIGLVQAAKLGPDGVRRLRDDIGADGMALHLNPAQELTQPEGDRDFRGGYRAVEMMVAAFGDRLLVKETGCGISPSVATRLKDLGVKNLDVSGLGGTSWVRVEQLRATGMQAELGAQFSGWGVPTAAAVASVRLAAPNAYLIASGGMRTGLDAAKAIALGAQCVGMALPLFLAQQKGGTKGAHDALSTLVAGVKQAFLLTGSRNASEMKQRPKVIVGDLKDWIAALGAG